MTGTLGEDRYVVAAFKALGGFLDGSGWVNALANEDIESSGAATKSFLNVSHLAKA